MLRLRGVDLNLLVVFQQLYDLRNTSQVAEKLGISQPAVSNCLARLRKQLNDELFQRSAHGMSPTPYADQIADAIGAGLTTLETGLGAVQNFDPATSERVFRIAMSEMMEADILPILYHYLKTRAPGICIQSVGERDSLLKQELEQGDVDLAIGFFPQLQAGFYQRGLIEDPYVCLLRSGHPMLEGENSIARLALFDHLIVEARNTGHSHVEQSLRNAGIEHTKEFHVPSFLSAPFIVRDSDLIVTLPKRFALTVSIALGLEVLPHAVNIEPCWVRLFWHRRYHRDQGLVWLRQLLVDLRGSSAPAVVLENGVVRIN